MVSDISTGDSNSNNSICASNSYGDSNNDSNGSGNSNDNSRNRFKGYIGKD